MGESLRWGRGHLWEPPIKRCQFMNSTFRRRQGVFTPSAVAQTDTSTCWKSSSACWVEPGG